MLQRKKPKIKTKRRRLLDMVACRRRIKRNVAVNKLHQRRRHYVGCVSSPNETA